MNINKKQHKLFRNCFYGGFLVVFLIFLVSITNAGVMIVFKIPEVGLIFKVIYIFLGLLLFISVLVMFGYAILRVRSIFESSTSKEFWLNLFSLIVLSMAAGYVWYYEDYVRQRKQSIGS